MFTITFTFDYFLSKIIGKRREMWQQNCPWCNLRISYLKILSYLRIKFIIRRLKRTLTKQTNKQIKTKKQRKTLKIKLFVETLLQNVQLNEDNEA